MDRPAGSFIEDENGNLKPNLDDKAMMEREINKTEVKKEVDNA